MGTKEYHAQKSREWYEREKIKNPDKLKQKDIASKKRRTDKKAFWVNHFGNICNHCQAEFPQCVFEFHHIYHEEKELEPSHIFGLKDSTISKELMKCIMLCANCHRIEHDKLKYNAHSKRRLSS